MSGDGEDFLSRWSRRKLAAEQEETTQPASGEQVGEPSENVGDGSASELVLTPEEIAALPKVEDLTPDSDITLFLRKGVPETLKNAALRRMWALDPAIRDYVGDARDYAYDWNVPGSVPGNGPLRPTDDVGAMLKEIFGDRPEGGEQVAGNPPAIGVSHARAAEPAPDRTEAPDQDQRVNVISAPQHEGAQPRASRAVDDDADAAATAEQPSFQADVAPQADHLPAAAARPSSRRHGGAKPV